MLLQRPEPIPRCLPPYVPSIVAIVAAALLLALGLLAARGADGDIDKPAQGTVTPATNTHLQPRGDGIEGFVKDERGRPIAGARVESPGYQARDARKTLTDKNGHYALDNLIGESSFGYRVLVRAAGCSPLEQEVTPGTAGKRARVDFTLSPGHFLHGRVVGENGKPIAGAQVSSLETLKMGEPATQSDKDGRFEIDSLPAGATFHVFKPGYTKLFHVPLRLDSSGLVTVVLQPMGVIRGRVVDAESGKPLDHFTVWLNPPRTEYSPGVCDSTCPYPGRKFAASDGTFTLSDLTNKMTTEVSVIADGHTKCVVPVVRTVPMDDAKSTEFALKRIEPAKLATLSGRILDPKGRPIRGVNLRLLVTTLPYRGPDDESFQWYLITDGQMRGAWYCDQFLEAVSDREGRFEFKNVLPQKHWQLAYWGSGIPRDRVLGTSQTAPGPAPPLTIKPPQAAHVVVTIDRGKYPDISQVAAQLRGADGMPLQIDLKLRQAKLEIKDLAPGDYDLHLFGRPYFKDGGLNVDAVASQSVHLKPGETKQVRF